MKTHLILTSLLILALLMGCTSPAVPTAVPAAPSTAAVNEELNTASSPSLPSNSAPTSPARVLTGYQTPEEYQDQPAPSGASREFSTDFTTHSISFEEVLSGGPNKDGIPPVDIPNFIRTSEADEWLKPLEPVVVLQIGTTTRAYPLQILTWHEIVNDELDGTPVAVTFCPLCNTAIAFLREFDGRVLDFGTTGRLRFSNLLMYDRQTETWWQQATGEAVIGQYTGSQLAFLPAPIISWADFKAAHPEGEVLSRLTGFNRRYGSNPYAGYDNINSYPFLFTGELKEGLAPMARVLTVDLEGETVAYPYEILEAQVVINDEVAGQPVAIFWQRGTASALDTSDLAAGRDVGTANSFARTLDERTLTFVWQDGAIQDIETGSTWNILGQAISGSLGSAQLTPIVSVNHFWFSWAAFKPETRIYGLDELGALPDFPTERPTPAPPPGSD